MATFLVMCLCYFNIVVVFVSIFLQRKQQESYNRLYRNTNKTFSNNEHMCMACLAKSRKLSFENFGVA